MVVDGFLRRVVTSVSSVFDCLRYHQSVREDKKKRFCAESLNLLRLNISQVVLYLRMSFGDFVINRTHDDTVVVGLLREDSSNVTYIPFLEQCLGEGPTAAARGAATALVAGLATLDAALLAVVVSTNALVLLCVLLSRVPPRGSPVRDVGKSSRRFIGNLAAADALVGISTLYFFTFRYACAARAALVGRRWLCLSRFFLISNSHLTSAYSMAAIAVDRYVAIVHALRYREIMSYRRSTALLFGTWLLPALTNSVMFVWNHWRPDSFCEVEEVLPVPLVAGVGVFSHGTLLTVVAVTHYQIHRIAASMRSRMRLDSGGEAFGPAPAASPLVPTRGAIATKSARTVLLVTGCYFVCWTPYLILYVARAAGAAGFGVDVAFGLAHTFANLNYLVNPFIYAWKSAEVRFAIIAVCKRIVLAKGPSAVGCRPACDYGSSASCGPLLMTSI